MLSFGKAEVMLVPGGKQDPALRDVSVWFYSNRIQKLYEMSWSRPLEAAEAALAGETGAKGIEFVQAPLLFEVVPDKSFLFTQVIAVRRVGDKI